MFFWKLAEFCKLGAPDTRNLVYPQAIESQRAQVAPENLQVLLCAIAPGAASRRSSTALFDLSFEPAHKAANRRAGRAGAGGDVEGSECRAAADFDQPSGTDIISHEVAHGVGQPVAPAHRLEDQVAGPKGAAAFLLRPWRKARGRRPPRAGRGSQCSQA